MHKVLVALIAIFPMSAIADVNCTISEFEIDVYDHGGTYIHGKLDGSSVSWINIEGNATGGENASNRRLSLALSAQMVGKELNAYFSDIDSCSDYVNYKRVTGLKLKK